MLVLALITLVACTFVAHVRCSDLRNPRKRAHRHGDSKRVKKQMSWMKKYLKDKTIKEEAKADKTSHQLGQSLVHRKKVMESRVKAMMEKPLPPGFNTLGLAFKLASRGRKWSMLPQTVYTKAMVRYCTVFCYQ